ncbi:MAG TPA: hypothetical protein VFH62_03640, partial [Dehalococcoidia bacterium]|nr:hypothetical protein [Dehalococcoidia bacterium]
MANEERPKPPAWLSTAGSRKARAGKQASRGSRAPITATPPPPRKSARRSPEPSIALSDNARVVL